jgi:hypothetical protein
VRCDTADQVAQRVRMGVDAPYLSWDHFAAAGKGLVVWEAFVTGAAKKSTHMGDALLAATTFSSALPNPMRANAVEVIDADRPFSLIGAALIWAGRSSQTDLLHTSALLIKPSAVNGILTWTIR